MEPGGTATVTVTMRNTGTTTWKRTVATETTRQSIRKTLSIFGLRAIGHDWGVRTVNVSGSAAPNALYRFQFTITAPEKPATYPFQRRMVRDTIIVDIPTVPASLDWGFGAVTPRKLIVVAKAPPPPPDTAPSFEGAPIPDQEWLVGQAIKSVTLPAATGGNGTLNYSFFGCRLPGGVRRSGRLIHGTPTAVKEVTCTWKVTDSDANRAESDTAKLTFKIIVRQPVLVLSKASLQVKENGSSDFTVKLGAPPTDTVTVSLTSGDATAVGVPTSLAFTTTDYGEAQTVTVTGKDDPDAHGENTSVKLVASGGGYAGISASVGVKVTDDDTYEPPIVDPESQKVDEGANGTLDVRLSTQPIGDVTVSVTSDNGAVTVEPASLTFTESNYASVQTVTVTAAEDDDAATRT